MLLFPHNAPKSAPQAIPKAHGLLFEGSIDPIKQAKLIRCTLDLLICVSNYFSNPRYVHAYLCSFALAGETQNYLHLSKIYSDSAYVACPCMLGSVHGARGSVNTPTHRQFYSIPDLRASSEAENAGGCKADHTRKADGSR